MHCPPCCPILSQSSYLHGLNHQKLCIWFTGSHQGIPFKNFLKTRVWRESKYKETNLSCCFFNLETRWNIVLFFCVSLVPVLWARCFNYFNLKFHAIALFCSFFCLSTCTLADSVNLLIQWMKLSNMHKPHHWLEVKLGSHLGWPNSRDWILDSAQSIQKWTDRVCISLCD